MISVERIRQNRHACRSCTVARVDGARGRKVAEAYATLYDWLGPALLRTARTMLRSGADAEDAVQDVFVNLVRSRHRLGQVEDLAAYVFSMLRHGVGRRLQQRAAERRKVEDFAAMQRDAAAPPLTEADEELERGPDCPMNSAR